MRPAFVVQIETPKKIVLDGLWFGPKRAKTVIILIHGLGGSLWRRAALAEPLVGNDTALLAFNNRGHDRITRLVKASQHSTAKNAWAGGACEVFTDCVDDIEGAVRFAKRHGAKNIFLAGHSTGSQKAVYYASKKKNPQIIKGVILMVPLSDYSVALRDFTKEQLARAATAARVLIRKGKPHELLPQPIWPLIDDAQRFISLYTPDSAEEMFLYAQPQKNPKVFSSVRIPILAIFAGADEYADRPAQEIAGWFKKHTKSSRFSSCIVPKVGHGFKGGEVVVARAIKNFMKDSLV